MLIREFVQNPAFDVNCYVKIFDSTKEAGWKGKIPVYDGYGAPVDTSEDILSMELSYVTTNQHEIIPVLFVFAEPYQMRKMIRTDCHILKLNTQYIVSIDGKDMENIPVKEDVNREDYALEITEKFNLVGMLLKTEYLLHVPTTVTVIQ